MGARILIKLFSKVFGFYGIRPRTKGVANMAGHSKWNNIKRKKGATDEKRGKLFTKIGREISVAVKQGGADPETNSKLRDAIANAKANNMPNDTIARSIQKAAGGGDGANYEKIVYEGYGPSGVAVIVETLTDNRNRTAGDMRHYFDKFGGNLGQVGCVTFMFTSENDEYVPIAMVKLSKEEDVKNMEKLLDHLEDNDDVQMIYHNWEWEDEEEFA